MKYSFEVTHSALLELSSLHSLKLFGNKLSTVPTEIRLFLYKKHEKEEQANTIKNPLYRKTATKTLLTAIDETMNSTTMFLNVQVDTLLTVSNYRDKLSKFLHRSSFREMKFELGQQREWYTSTRWDVRDDGRIPRRHLNG